MLRPAFVAAPLLVAALPIPAIAGFTVGSPPGDGILGGLLGTFNGEAITEDLARQLADAEGDPLIDWSTCGTGFRGVENDCLVLTVGNVYEYRELLLSDRRCVSGAACYAGYLIDHEVVTSAVYDSVSVEWEETYKMRVEWPSYSGGRSTKVMSTYGTGEAYASTSSYWVTYYDADGEWLSGAGVVADGTGGDTCELIGDTVQAAAVWAVDFLFDEAIGVKSIQCDMLETFATLTASGNAGIGKLAGEVEATRSLEFCDDELNEWVEGRTTRVEQVAAVLEAATEAACDDCPNGTVMEEVFITDDDGTTECVLAEYDCDGTKDTSGFCNCELQGVESGC